MLYIALESFCSGRRAGYNMVARQMIAYVFDDMGQNLAGQQCYFHMITPGVTAENDDQFATSRLIFGEWDRN